MIPHSRQMWWRWGATVALALLMIPLVVNRSGTGPTRIPYSSFMRYLDSGRVAEVEVGPSEIQGRLRAPDAHGDTLFVTTRVDPALIPALQQHGVVFSGGSSSSLTELLVAMLPPLALLALFIWMMRHTRTSATETLSFGKNRQQVYAERDTKVTFDDVAGVDEAKAELKEVVEFLKSPAAFGRLGARMPKGVLLVGPPGTGKTLLARAVAGQAGVPFLSINGSEFVELFVGVGAARVRDLFEHARTSAPCIVFIDEIDALGRARGIGTVPTSNDEKEQTLNQLLAEMDGFDPSRGVIMLAATNRPEILDPALLRAGRFDRQIVVDRPDRAGRVQILCVHIKAVHVAPELDLDQIAALTPGFTGADLANLVNEAALTATRRGADAVSLGDFTIAIERIVAGLARKSRVLTPRERQITAYHEMGHAIVALATPGADPVQKVSIIPRGMGALGYTMQRPAEDRYIATRAELDAKMTVMLGGRAAEIVVFSELSTGAADDLVRATELAREMVMRYGMDATVGNAVYRDGSIAPESRLYSEQTARDIESAVRGLLQSALDRAVAVLTLNRPSLDTGARLLLDRETLTRDQLPSVTPAPEEETPCLTSGKP